MNLIEKASTNTITIETVIKDQFDRWFDKQSSAVKNWVSANQFQAKSAQVCLIADSQGSIEKILLGLEDDNDFWAFGALPGVLVDGEYELPNELSDSFKHLALIAFALGCYQFTVYKKAKPRNAKLVIPKSLHKQQLSHFVTTAFLIRDLINTPTEDMGPAELAEAVYNIAEEFGAKVSEIIGDDLLEQGYPAIHAVGRGSVHQPRFVQLTWGNPKHKKIALVGKGVCFDTGGLDIKPAAAMLPMKKDMAGAAHAIGLARLIMAHQLPLHISLYIPAVENAVSANAYRPSEVIATRKGLSVEILNTDAEGRVILCDALAEAASHKPDLLIDFGTLTGAASIALGSELPALFSNDNQLAQALMQCGDAVFDPLWLMPLYKPYRRFLDSPIADLANTSLKRYSGGAICAALYLNEFVPNDISWAHFDFMAANVENLPGRPIGGEVQALRAVFHYIREHFV